MLRKEDGDAKELKENVFSLTLVFFFTQGANVYSSMIAYPGSEHTRTESTIQAATTEKAYLLWNRAGVQDETTISCIVSSILLFGCW